MPDSNGGRERVTLIKTRDERIERVFAGGLRTDVAIRGCAPGAEESECAPGGPTRVYSADGFLRNRSSCSPTAPKPELTTSTPFEVAGDN